MFRVLPALMLVAGTVFATSARAQADQSATLRVDVRVARTSDARLFDRLRGQTSDLPIELQAYAPEAPLGDFAQTVTLAFAQCRARGADVVAWCQQAKPTKDAGPSWVVALATCRDGRVLARPIATVRPARGSAVMASGTLEAAALVLRGALSVLVQGGTLGVLPAGSSDLATTTPASGSAEDAPAGDASLGAPSSAGVWSGAASAGSRATSSSAPSSAQRSQARASTREREPEAEPSARRMNVLGLVGWEQSWNGTGPAGQPALSGALALGRKRFLLGVTGSFGFQSSQRDRYTTITLARHAVAATWRQRLWHTSGWSLSAGLDAGSAFYRRATQVHDSTSQANEVQLSPAPYLSVWSATARRLGPLWLSLCAALDVLPFVPRFLYRAGAETVTALRIWPVSPRVSLSFGLGRP